MAQRQLDDNRIYTADEFMEIAASDKLLELIEGKLTSVCAAAWGSSEIASRISAYLQFYAGTRGFGRVFVTDGSFRISETPDTVVQPDVAFVRSDRFEGQDPTTYYRGTPDIVVEVRSPSDRLAEMVRKMDGYLQAGTELTWLIDPLKRQIHVRTHHDAVAQILIPSDRLSGAPVLPGFSLPVEHIFDLGALIRPELVL